MTDIERALTNLIARLTLAEKITLMTGRLRFWPGVVSFFVDDFYHKGPIHSGGVPRLGIQGIRFMDGPRGAVAEGGATTFPVSIARGASFDPDLEERIGEAIGKEVRALGANLFGGVCVNVLRHPAWGRAQETYGEDSLHLGIMGTALTRGVQRHAMACVKHFALNSMENARFQVDVHVGSRALHEVYLPHFKRIVTQGKVASVMSAYNALNGQWCGEHQQLLTAILKERWGFQGFVLTDFVFGLRDARRAVLAGQDLEMPFQMHFALHLRALVERGVVPLERVDDAVRRVLRTQHALPKAPLRSVLGCQPHRDLAREAAQRSMVLLRNRDALLPFPRSGTLAVIGRFADVPNLGDRGSSDTRPKQVVTPLQGLRAQAGEMVTLVHDDGSDPKRAAQVAAGADRVLLIVGYDHTQEGEFLLTGDLGPFAAGIPAPRFLRQWMRAQGTYADRASRWLWKRFLGETSRVLRRYSARFLAQRGWGAGGDRRSLELPEEDRALIRAVGAANPKTAVAVMAGSAVIMEAWREAVGAILLMWYPGQEGGHALADLLWGDISPGGRLPFAIPARTEDLPDFDIDATRITYDLWHGYRKLDRDGVKAAYPFGFGLGYSSTVLSELCVSVSDGIIEASVVVRNTGDVGMDEVVQLYVSVVESKVERAVKELKAFKRVFVPVEERVCVVLHVPVAELAFFNEARDAFEVESGEVVVAVGHHSDDPHMQTARVTLLDV